VTTARRPVIGIVGDDVPRQLVLAIGAIPHRLTGSWSAPVDDEARALLGACDVESARILTRLRSGAAGVDALIVCNDSQAHLRLFYALRATTTATDAPVHLLDMPRADTVPARRFARFQLAGLAAFCVGATGGAALELSALRAAGEAERELGAALERMRERRRADPPGCTGAAALEACLAAARTDPADAVQRADAATSDVPPSAVRVHVTGSSHPDAALYRLLEQDGVVVVSEDHDTGDGAWLGAGVDGDSVAQIVERLIDAHFARVTGSATTPTALRAETTSEAAQRARADAVVALVRDLDEAPLWDLADQRAALAGRPLLAETRVPPGGEEEAMRRLADALARTAVRA
jgi:hypothetical protein